MQGRTVKPIKYHGFTIPKGAEIEITEYYEVEQSQWSSKAWDYVTTVRRYASIVWNGETLGCPRSSVKEL